MPSPRPLRIVIAVILGAALALSFAPTFAAAQGRAVVLEFGGGRNGAQARRAVVASLDGVIEVIPLETVEQAARTQHVDLSSAEGAGAAARAAGADLVISGSVSGRGARARTRLVVRDTAGRELASRRAGPPFGRQAQSALGDQAITMVQEAQNALARSGGGASADGGRDGGGGAYASDTGEPGGDGEDEEEGEAGDRTPGAAPLLRALVGLDARTRSAEVTLDDRGTRGYSAGLYPELMLAVELRPLAHSKGAVSGLFLGIEAAHSVGLSSALEGMTDTLGSSSLRFAGAIGWLVPFADGAVAIGPVLGGGIDGFTLDANTVFASSSYGYLRFGLGARIVLAGDALALGLSAGYRLVLGVGELAAAFGESATAYGLDVRAELGGALDVGFAYALRAGYESYGLGFEGGPGTLGQGVDGSDSALRVQLLVGWQVD